MFGGGAGGGENNFIHFQYKVLGESSMKKELFFKK